MSYHVPTMTALICVIIYLLKSHFSTRFGFFFVSHLQEHLIFLTSLVFSPSFSTLYKSWLSIVKIRKTGHITWYHGGRKHDNTGYTLHNIRQTEKGTTLQNHKQQDSSRHTTTEGILYSNLNNYKKDYGTKHPD